MKDDTEFEVKLSKTGVRFRVSSDQTILEAIEQAGVYVPYSCREGICGTCETRVLSGRPDHKDEVLSDDEKANGDTMMICISRSKDPLIILDL